MSTHVSGRDFEDLKWLCIFLSGLRRRQTNVLNNNNNVIPRRQKVPACYDLFWNL